MQYTKSLLHFRNPNDLFFDEVPNSGTYTKNYPNIGTVSQVTNGQKYGYGVQIANIPSYIYKQNVYRIYKTCSIGGEDFTAECWLKSGNTIVFADIYPQEASDDVKSNSYWSGIVNRNWLGIYNGYNHPFWWQGTFLSNENNDKHLAFVYDNTAKTITTYLNGVKKQTITNFGLNKNPNAQIGFILPQGGTFIINEFRWSNIKRYTDSFTPSTQPFVYGPYVTIPKSIMGEYDKSPNGLKYKYRIRFEQGTITETSNVVNYVTEHKRRQPWAA